MRVVVVGAGYVGLISAACLAAKGHDVRCVDVDAEVVSNINAGVPHIYERGLEELLAQVLAAGSFSATTDLATALVDAEIVLIAVGTPDRDGAIDLGQVRRAARDIGAFIAASDRRISIVVKSTVVPGTTDTIVRQEIEAASGKAHPAFGLGMNPEFLREGEAVEDFMAPDRIVFGHEDEKTLARLEALYAPWDCDKVRVNTRTAELIKYANNALLATQISAINEIANLAAAVGGIDVLDVVEGVRLDRRWSPIVAGERISPAILSYLVPGCGFGGSCFPKDVQALRSLGQEQGLAMGMLDAVLGVNEAQPRQIADILERRFGGLAGRKCLVLGLAFKPDTDDVRASASLAIVRDLLKSGARVSAHDPVAAENFRRALGDKSGDVALVGDWRAAAAEAEIIVVATRWDEYRDLARCDLAGKTVFDARRLLTPRALEGAEYLTIGRRVA